MCMFSCISRMASGADVVGGLPGSPLLDQCTQSLAIQGSLLTPHTCIPHWQFLPCQIGARWPGDDWEATPHPANWGGLEPVTDWCPWLGVSNPALCLQVAQACSAVHSRAPCGIRLRLDLSQPPSSSVLSSCPHFLTSFSSEHFLSTHLHSNPHVGLFQGTWIFLTWLCSRY